MLHATVSKRMIFGVTGLIWESVKENYVNKSSSSHSRHHIVFKILQLDDFGLTISIYKRQFYLHPLTFISSPVFLYLLLYWTHAYAPVSFNVVSFYDMPTKLVLCKFLQAAQPTALKH